MPEPAGPPVDLSATIAAARRHGLADLLTRTGREYILRGVLEELVDDYDWVLLDCPPSLGVLTVAALTAADGVLIPLQCETLSHRGVGQLLDTVHDVRRFTKLALEFGFEASSGSDFHGPGESPNVELGRVPTLSPELTPVWHRFV